MNIIRRLFDNLRTQTLTLKQFRCIVCNHSSKQFVIKLKMKYDYFLTVYGQDLNSLSFQIVTEQVIIKIFEPNLSPIVVSTVSE